jgi:hypothetical protein
MSSYTAVCGKYTLVSFVAYDIYHELINDLIYFQTVPFSCIRTIGTHTKHAISLTIIYLITY